MKRLSIDEMRAIAKAHEGKCLSEKYINNSQKLTWQCKQSHKWNATANNVKNGTWCPQCAGNQLLSIEEIRAVAESRGGKCLSEKYINSKTLIKWQCAKGHIWLASPDNIRSGSWCDSCARTANANKLRGSIETLHKIAKQRGGECLSEIYTHAHSIIRWKCNEGHIWENSANNVKRGQWCNICSSKRAGLSRRNTIEEMHKIAQARGGLCLSREYLGNKKLLQWQCAQGHQWNAAPSSIKCAESWCPKCGYESSADIRKKDIQIMYDVAKNRGGECLSSIHKSVNAKLRWCCAHNHEWSAAPVKILRGSWCPICSSHLGERICREFLEQIFQHPFPKARPKWLTNSEGNRAELDGYCPELSLAFEHHGQYHYQIDNLYSKNEAELAKRKKEDQYKEKVCLEHGIKTIVIPEIFTLTPIEKVVDIIESQCLQKEIDLPLNLRSIIVDLKKAYSNDHSKTLLEELKQIAREYGGKCLSTNYERSSAKMKWECIKGHIWEATPGAIRRGSWCLKCSGHERLSLQEMKLIAQSKGGKCLSEEYVNAHVKLKWECAVGHIWEAIPNSVKHRGTWCRRCAGKKNYTNFLKSWQLKTRENWADY